MLNFTIQELNQMLIESVKITENLRSKLTATNSDIKQFNQNKAKLEQNIKAQENKLEAAQKALILVQNVPLKVSQMRDRLLRKMQRARREDITIAESKNLRTEIETLKVELQKACSHPFVYDEPGYEGSASHDYENRYPCVRYCIVCGFMEETYNLKEVAFLKKEYFFKILTSDDSRMIIDQPWTSEGRKRINIWIPLGAALSPFEESVARVLNG